MPEDPAVTPTPAAAEPPAPDATLLPTPVVTPASAWTPTPTSCSPGRVEQGALTSTVAGEAMAYRVYLPPCYGEDGRVYPALYMFGGNVHDETIWDVLGLDDAAEAAILSGTIPPLIIVMPDNGWLANTTTSGPNSYEGFVLNELIPYVENSYCAWAAPEGRAVGGLSRGGYWSLMMSFRQPATFRSVAAHSPALIDSEAGPGEDPRLTATSSDLSHLRIYIDIGARDPYLPEAQQLHDALAEAGVMHTWLVNEGTHEEAYWRANLGEYLAWYGAGFPAGRGALPACGRP